MAKRASPTVTATKSLLDEILAETFSSLAGNALFDSASLTKLKVLVESSALARPSEVLLAIQPSRPE
jgi:hypothetical protein